jgi:hypothetical protein
MFRVVFISSLGLIIADEFSKTTCGEETVGNAISGGLNFSPKKVVKGV